MNRGSLVWVGAGLALFGCGSPSDPPTAGEACGAYASKFCGDIQTCAPGFMALLGFSTLADCVSSYTSGCQTGTATPHSGFVPSRIQSCANAYAQTSCTAFLSSAYPPACVPAGGTVVTGGSCLSDWQCASGRCSSQPNQCGTCVPAIARGGACDPDANACASNLACAPAATGSTSFVCTAYAAIGAACTDGSVCPVSAYCEPDTHVCTALPRLGEPCDPHAMYLCDVTGPAAECDSASSTCVAGPTPVPVGTSCDAADHGLTTDTACAGSCAGAGDGGPGICQPYLQAGESCALGEICAGGLACVNGVCGTCSGSPSAAAAHRAPRVGVSTSVTATARLRARFGR